MSAVTESGTAAVPRDQEAGRRMPIRWRVELFGELRVTQISGTETRAITRFRTQKTASLLAYLAFYRHRSHSREVLAELIWPDTDPRAGRNSLNTAVSSLRRQLEPPPVLEGTVIQADRFTVRLNPATVETDVADFETALRAAAVADGPDRIRQLEAASQLCGGELLPGLYEEWIGPERTRLAAAAVQTLGRLSRLLEEAEELDRAIEVACRMVRAEPLREEAHRELIRLYAAAGQRSAAVAQYRELERILAEEIGGEPGPATRALLRRALQEEPAVREPVPRTREVRQPKTSRPEEVPPEALPPVPPAQRAASLPVPLTRFFGRAAEIELLLRVLAPEGMGVWVYGCVGVEGPGTHTPIHPHTHTRLLTITGPGGTGKTRLAVELGRRLAAAGGPPLYFVPLAEISDPRRIPAALLDALRVSHSPTVEPLVQAVEALGREPVLLILDNFEQLVPDGVPVVQRLLEEVPTLRCLVTSRHRLDLPGEREFPIAPLPIPADGLWLMANSSELPNSPPDSAVRAISYQPSAISQTSHQPSAINQYESVQMFVDRAQAVRPDFQVTPHNAAALAAVCSRLEGIPLAIELAAARVQVLTPAQMLAQLDHRFDFLVSRRRIVEERHRTLRAAVDWSYRLLSPELQRLFARLSVFRGGWTLEAADAVCGCMGVWVLEPHPHTHTPTHRHTHTLLDALQQLRESSLLLAEEEPEGMRFRMLETLREYAAECLSPEERRDVERGHARYYRELAEREAAESKGAHWLERLEREQDNFRAALEWAAREGEAELAAGLALGLAPLLYHRGQWVEARETLETGRAAAGEKDAGLAPLRARIEGELGGLCADMGDPEEGRRHAEAALALFQAIEDPQGTADALNLLGVVRLSAGEPDAARACFEEVLRLRSDHRGRAIALHNLANAATQRGETAEARRLYEEALVHRRAAGDSRGEAETLQNLGTLAQLSGDCGLARRLYRDALALYDAVRYPYGVAMLLHNLGELEELEGRDEAAVSLFVHAGRLLGRLHSRHARAPEQELARLAQRLGPTRFEELRREAETLAWAETVAALGIE